MKVAVIGSGAAGAGVVLGLLASGVKADIAVFDAAEPLGADEPPAGDPRAWPKGEMAAIYARSRREHGFSLPLPKSHYGVSPPRLTVNGRARIWRSRMRGGLTNLWGGTMLPLDEADFERWPVGFSELAPYYAAIADAVGVSGRNDPLSRALPFDPANRPPIRMHPMIARLVGAVNAAAEGPASPRAGVNRIALETRPEAENGCVFCGECLIGCFRGAPFTTADWFEQWRRQGVVSLSDAAVSSINPEARTLRLSDGGAESTAGPFDRIFLAAGCLGSSRILMATCGLDEVEFEDSRVMNLPLVYTGASARTEPDGEGFGLTNGLVLIPGEDGRGIVAQAQLYPTLPHYWRSVLPGPLWPAASLLAGPLRARLVWARIYLAAPAANRYRLRAGESVQEAELVEASDGARLAGEAASRLARALRGSGFRALQGLAMNGGTSSHYAAARPFRSGDGIVSGGHVIAPGVHLADSTPWPEVPAMSPTLTIMANAMRIAREAS